MIINKIAKANNVTRETSSEVAGRVPQEIQKYFDELSDKAKSSLYTNVGDINLDSTILAKRGFKKLSGIKERGDFYLLEVKDSSGNKITQKIGIDIRPTTDYKKLQLVTTAGPYQSNIDYESTRGHIENMLIGGKKVIINNLTKNNEYVRPAIVWEVTIKG